MRLFGRLADASGRVLRDHMNPMFAEAGLRPGEFDVIATLRRLNALLKKLITAL